MLRRVSYLMASLAVALAALPAGAQSTSPTSACGGNTFWACVVWSASTDASHGGAIFTVTNTSNLAPASNPNSVFTLLGIGTNATVTGIGGISSANFAAVCSSTITGCTGSNVANTFNGQGLTTTGFFGLAAVPPPSHTGLMDGQSVSFELFFAEGTDLSSVLTTDQLAIHDQGGPVSGCSTKLVVNANGTVTSAGQVQAGCGTSTVPEPSSMALLGTGLVGLVPMVRRRRK